MKQLYTRWGRTIDPEHVLPEYPRELLRRASWTNLNGYWDYAFTPVKDDDGMSAGREIPGKWDGRILVPFSPEAVLSGVSRQLRPDEYLWYRRSIPPIFENGKPKYSSGRVILHFGAVDQSCAVFVNGRKAAEHMGGYLPFDVDITDYLKESSEEAESNVKTGEGKAYAGNSHEAGSGEDEIVLRVRDVSDTSWHSRGKQKLRRGGMWYTATSGIWQTVWLEEVPANHIEEIDTHPDTESGLVKLVVRSAVDAPVRITVHMPEISINTDIFEVDDNALMQGVFFTGTSNHEITMRIPEPKLWTCEEPWLYRLDVRMGDDLAGSYFAYRSIEVRKDDRGIQRICLNGEPVYMKGVLDQGYWPDGMYTAPSDEAMVFDLNAMKAAGFNMVRKHAKIEPDRWYYHCDRLGLLVWQDIVNGGETYRGWFVRTMAVPMSWAGIPIKDRHEILLSRSSKEGRREFIREISETVRVLKYHPSVVCWTLFNEGWGQFATEQCTKILRKADPTRLIDAASGWFDQGCGDIKSIHYYYLTFEFRPDGRRAFAVSEFGGLTMKVQEHTASDKTFGYGKKNGSTKEITKDYNKLTDKIEKYVRDGLCASVYTQWTDVEDEQNGIYTWDREIKKIDAGS